MAETTTDRIGVRQWSAGTDTPNRTDFQTSFANIEGRVAGWIAPNTLANRPGAAAAYDRFLFHAHDTDQLFICVDTTGGGAYAWKQVGLGESVTVSATAPTSPNTNEVWIDTSA